MGPALGTFYCTSPGGCGCAGPGGCVPSAVPAHAAPPAAPTPMSGPAVPGGRSANSGGYEQLPPSRGYAMSAEAAPEIPPSARMTPGLPRRGCQGGSDPVAVPLSPARVETSGISAEVPVVDVPYLPESQVQPGIDLPTVPSVPAPPTGNPVSIAPPAEASDVLVVEFRAARVITVTDSNIKPANCESRSAPAAPPFARLVALPADTLIKAK
jgi:hypothetical protein